VGNWRGRGPYGTWSFGSIQDGTSPLTWGFPPRMTGGVTTPETSFSPAFIPTVPQAGADTPKKLVLPAKNTNEGVEARVLLAECATPEAPSYSLADAVLCMQLMDLVLWNRLADPRPFLAPGAKSLKDIVRARGQFQGFEKYPDYNAGLVKLIQTILNIANNPKDRRQNAYAGHVDAALTVASGERITDPSPGVLAAWRTQRRGSPGGNFTLYRWVLGTSFYYIGK
jgi:hypothetical protein